jgi:glucose/arabinose dehydrogenase
VPHLAAAGVTALLAAVAGLAAPAASAQAPYTIPPDNPFVATPGARAEVYLYGMRNPYRWSFDRLTGDMYVGDVGGIQEEITYLPRAGSAGRNLGWNCLSGTAVQAGCVPANYVPPAHTYPSSADVVIGGYVVRDPSLPAFIGRYLYGQFGTGIFDAGPQAALTPVNRATITSLSSLGEDGIGRLYAVSLNGPVYRLTQTGATLTLSPIGNFIQPVAVAAPPGDPNRLFVVEKAGRVTLQTGAEFLDVTGLVRDAGGEEGLLALAVAPDYAVSGRVFVFYTDNAGNLQLDEFRRTSAAPERADPATRRPLLTIPHGQADNHNGGQLLFGPDGYLYLSTGDGGTQGDPEGDAQNLGSLLGKILRINPNPAPGAPPPAPLAPADTQAPVLRTRVPRRQRVLRLRGAVAYAGCNEACTIAAAGVLRVGKRRLRLSGARRVARASQAGRRLRLKVRLGRRQARILRRALRRGRRPLVRLTLRATDPAGNRSSPVRRTVRVRRARARQPRSTSLSRRSRNARSTGFEASSTARR